MVRAVLENRHENRNSDNDVSTIPEERRWRNDKRVCTPFTASTLEEMRSRVGGDRIDWPEPIIHQLKNWMSSFFFSGTSSRLPNNQVNRVHTASYIKTIIIMINKWSGFRLLLLLLLFENIQSGRKVQKFHVTMQWVTVYSFEN